MVYSSNAQLKVYHNLPERRPSPDKKLPRSLSFWLEGKRPPLHWTSGVRQATIFIRPPLPPCALPGAPHGSDSRCQKNSLSSPLTLIQAVIDRQDFDVLHALQSHRAAVPRKSAWLERLRGLAQLYNEHPDFVATFTRIHPDLPPFLRRAIEYYCQKRFESSLFSLRFKRK